MKKRLVSPASGFTLVELLTVMVIILILAGLVLGTVGFAQKKAARSRADGEIRALETALESYKNDNAVYPENSDTDALDAKTKADPSTDAYKKASLYLYGQLSGDADYDGVTDTTPTLRTNYMGTGFKSDMLAPTTPGSPIKAGNLVTYLSDPFGNSYGYSTAYLADQAKNSGVTTADPSTYKGYNSTFDLWSTSGNTTLAKQPQWIKNWQ